MTEQQAFLSLLGGRTTEPLFFFSVCNELYDNINRLITIVVNCCNNVQREYLIKMSVCYSPQMTVS